LEREGRRRGIEVDEAELEQALQAHLATWLDERCKGDRAEFERQLARRSATIARATRLLSRGEAPRAVVLAHHPRHAHDRGSRR
jgi:hypothetical protein